MFLAASALYGQSQDAACTMCHGNSALTMTRQGRSVSLFVDSAKLKSSAHNALACSSCHINFNGLAIPHANPVQPVNCESCHSIEGFAESVHAKSGAATCKSCHGTHEVQPVKNPASGLTRTTVADACGKCHATESADYKTSKHALALDRMPQSPTCVSCHGAHDVNEAGSAGSPLRRGGQHDFCLSCHLNDLDVLKQAGLSEQFMSAYESSVHGRALAGGNDNAATCGNCHGVHNVGNAQSASSMINRSNLADTCGQCHAEVSAAFKDSVHGQSVARGGAESPSCNTCHGYHHIYSTQDDRSAVSRANIAARTCTGCHNSLIIGEKYGIPADNNAFFADSFHGIAARGGSGDTPTCAVCHGVHNIKSVSNPDSTVNAENLTTTCSQCHPGANEKFARVKVHAGEISDQRAGLVFWIRTIYIVLIVVTIGLMFAHNLLDFIKRTLRNFDVRWGRLSPAHHGIKHYLRMTMLDRVQHLGLLVSFLLLVLTGFMLRFPDASWVGVIRTFCEPFFEVRGIVHRVAAVVITAVSLFHVGVIIFTRHGRKFAADMFPRWSDVKDVFANMRYLLGLSSQRPRFDRFSYMEKAEYWALVWGMVIMFASGIVLWFFVFFLNRFGIIVWELAKTVHYYEAVLAALAIVVWHFYYVLFNPGIYPMNTAWINGKMPEEEMAEEHPLELERILRQEQEAQARETQAPETQT